MYILITHGSCYRPYSCATDRLELGDKLHKYIIFMHFMIFISNKSA